MPDLTLTRNAYLDFGTYGWMVVKGDDEPYTEIVTVERRWLDNEPFLSCIPEGQYQCRPQTFHRGNGGLGYEAIEVCDVPGRTHILFHKANWPREVTGCIAPNLRLVDGSSDCPMRGADSKGAFDLLMKSHGGREFTLEIKQERGATL